MFRIALLMTVALVFAGSLMAGSLESFDLQAAANGLGLGGIAGAVLWVGRQLGIILSKLIDGTKHAADSMLAATLRMERTAESLESTAITFAEAAKHFTAKALLLLALLTLPMLAGCNQADVQYVRADQTLWQALVPDLVDAEGNLRPGVRTLIETTDQLNDQQRADLLLLLEAWRIRLKAWNADPEPEVGTP